MSQKPARPGEWWLVLSVLGLLVGPVLIGITVEMDAEVAAMKKDGVVSEAVVVSRRSEERTRTSNKGRTRTSTSYLLTLSYDLMSKNRFADWNEGKVYEPAKYPAKTTAEIEVSQAHYESLTDGAKTMAVMLPGQFKSLALADEMKRLATGVQSMIQYAVSAAAILLGFWSGWRWWKARKAAKLATAEVA
jgi:hypothetical protein